MLGEEAREGKTDDDAGRRVEAGEAEAVDEDMVILAATRLSGDAGV